MLNALEFAKFLKDRIGFCAGVPDSLLKPLNQALEIEMRKDFYTTATEGQAVAFACAYHLATSKIGLVYLQNSGLGSAINPLLSLADPKVYKIPLILFVGLRGGIDDEPQHLKQGEVTEQILIACGIKTLKLSKEIEEAKRQIDNSLLYCRESGGTVAFLVEKNIFDKVSLPQSGNSFSLIREEVINLIQDAFVDAKFVTTTGMISRECYELREFKNQRHKNDFLVVGSMGYASSLAFILSKYSNKKFVCLDGDGAFIMHMGSLLSFKGASFYHIVLNNYAHDSVGGQATNIGNTNLVELAYSCGYDYALSVESLEELQKALKEIPQMQGLVLLEVKVKKQTRANLGRPKEILRLKDEFCKGL
ncbi:phosphonopyruvate decarboxylase [Helicobacter winghamensis]|uniref:Phosphonopyruvate decarboxylase n=1 Tax=Helicobacter winghamensis TaxID=157268 RepID=A0A2N3PJ72_9HELI|nr:phosphonopyruvate decarboxylase [Helicobacter winghamensis]EEO25449.1 phosphonopyruvate decarboxylase [Helicobacter winghamensis ATCC BAA-430]PKT78123.1 phosphonopyruvate decarboxylase [Helicobacter winghamensis]PKT78392.1 phosphonopyruvate decarboxylase [Helicobacter winghamensis]PKT78652.1 phosphonopyruvate decarboxylase [Helicobacter winghamensis]PKT80423.1 phosphonopyruvate decarboxylase [Helicobacter winghamensis]